jgi:hypothetical protein
VADVVKPGDKSPRIQVEFQEETVWPEGKDKLVIGRDSKTADIHVPDDTAEPGISRKQAELAREDDGTISLHHYGTNPTKVRKFKSDDGYVGEVVLEKGKSPESMFLEPGYTYRLYFISGEGVKVVTVSIPEEKPEPVSAAAPKGTPKPATGGSPAISAYKRQMAERGEATVDEVKTKLGSKCNPAIETIVARLFTEGAVKAYKSAPDAVAEDLIYSRSKGKTISPKEVEFVLGVDGDFRMLGEPGKKFKSWKELTKADMEDNAYLFKVRLIVNPETGEVIKVAVTFAPRPGEGQPPTSLIGELNNIKRALQGLKLPVDLYMTPDDMK